MRSDNDQMADAKVVINPLTLFLQNEIFKIEQKLKEETVHEQILQKGGET